LHLKFGPSDGHMISVLHVAMVQSI